MDWQNRLLEDLVYERIRQYVDVPDLIDFERDLCESISRALRATAGRAGLGHSWPGPPELGATELPWSSFRDVVEDKRPLRRSGGTRRPSRSGLYSSYPLGGVPGSDVAAPAQDEDGVEPRPGATGA
jgi:hypothetical protein